MATLIQELMLIVLTFVINILFGYWRAATEKLTLEWFLSVHLPIPVIYGLRMIYEVPVSHIPVFVVAYFLGQLSGSKIRRALEFRSSLTKCLIVDLMRLWYPKSETF